MRLVEADGPALLGEFRNFPERVYDRDPNYRRISGEYASILMPAASAFSARAGARAYLGADERGSFACRFILLRDGKAPRRVVVCAFEALPGLRDVGGFVMEAARRFGPAADSVVVGLNGHLNYGAGILMSRFDEPPLYDSNYNPPYYAEYFKNFTPHYLSTFLFPLAPCLPLVDRLRRSMGPSGIGIRPFDKKNAAADLALYTRLNNDCFSGHFLWTDRESEDDAEMFSHVLPFLKPENLLFAEKDGQAVGFLMWLPDFARACPRGRASLPASLRWKNPAKAAGGKCRLYEIAVLPAFRKSTALPLLLDAFVRTATEAGFGQCEGGFILESNLDSMLTAKRYIERATGSSPEAHRRLAVFTARRGDPCWN